MLRIAAMKATKMKKAALETSILLIEMKYQSLPVKVQMILSQSLLPHNLKMNWQLNHSHLCQRRMKLLMILSVHLPEEFKKTHSLQHRRHSLIHLQRSRKQEVLQRKRKKKINRNLMIHLQVHQKFLMIHLLLHQR